MTKGAVPAQPISAVERDTGIARDTLRVWERRYGFPQPLRDRAGERVYPPDQVRRLHLIRRLLNRGMRPGAVVALKEEELLRISADAVSEQAAGPTAPRLAGLCDAIGSHDTQRLAHLLEDGLHRDGLRRLVIDSLVPLIHAVGEAWATGRLEVYEEHFMTRELSRFLDAKIGALPVGAEVAPVLIATLPGERHALGLLLVEVLLRERGSPTVNLGVDLAVDQLRQAAMRYCPAALALSFSGSYPYSAVRRDLEALVRILPPGVAVWVGGEGVRRLRKGIPGVTVMRSLEEL